MLSSVFCIWLPSTWTLPSSCTILSSKWCLRRLWTLPVLASPRHRRGLIKRLTRWAASPPKVGRFCRAVSNKWKEMEKRWHASWVLQRRACRCLFTQRAGGSAGTYEFHFISLVNHHEGFTELDNFLLKIAHRHGNLHISCTTGDSSVALLVYIPVKPWTKPSTFPTRYTPITPPWQEVIDVCFL